MRRGELAFIIFVVISLSIIGVINYIQTNKLFDNALSEQESSLSKHKSIEILINGQIINAEVAQTENEKAQGLMYREEMDTNSGMLFIYSDEEERVFWMMNTYITLDIIFLDKDKKVVSISANTKPNQTDELYYSLGKAMYVLELNSGKAEALKLKPGNEITF